MKVRIIEWKRKRSTKGRHLQRRQRNPVCLEAIVSRYVMQQLEFLAEDRQTTVSAVAHEILARHFRINPTTGRISVVPSRRLPTGTRLPNGRVLIRL